jgi:hypothetical protein
MILDKFPKTRSILSEEYTKIYAEHYRNNRDGATTSSSLTMKMESWLHKQVANDVKKNPNRSTLEIGAGTLNQLDFEHARPYDIVEPYKDLYINSAHLPKIRNIYNDIAEIGNGIKYDRITSIATFEHILNLPEVVAKSCLLLENQGTLRISIPNEGTFFWKLGWKLTSSIEFNMKYKLSYETFLMHEHVNTAAEIEEVLNHFFRKINCSNFGISRKIAFYRFFECSAPRIEAAEDYLHSISHR